MMRKCFFKSFHIVSLTLILSSLVGCIHNDLPYPRIPQKIQAIAARGQSRDAYIDSLAYEVTIYLDQTTDIENVEFSEYKISEGGESDPDLAVGAYDLTDPMTVILTRYQSYKWIVKAVQNIERFFTVKGQIGETVIDPLGHRVIVSMPEGTDLTKLILESVQLGAPGVTTLDPDIKPGPIDLSHPIRVAVISHGRSVYWTIYAQLTELVVTTDRADAWSKVVWVYGNGPADVDNGFQYRKAGDEEWIDVPAEFITQNQGAFSCYIPHLEPLTEYEVRSKSGEDIGNELSVTTQGTADIPNGDFENWYFTGKMWCPWAEGGVQFWDTGNTGTATMNQYNVQPSDHTPTGQGKAAMLDTRFVGLFGIGKLAAGSVFTGTFKKVDGTNGILDFGREWSLRPTKLRGYYQYETADINYASAEFADLKGRPDTCHIYVALADWTAPFEVRTNPKTRQLFDPTSPSIIAYGELVYSGKMTDYKPFEIELKYRDTSRVPTYLQITCASSKYGDYFTGGTGAVLYVDQLSFDWDY